MLFNSFTFAIFLPIVFLLYWFVFNRHIKVHNLLLLISSYVFYGWWDWRFLSLIFISSVSDFILGRMIFLSHEKAWRKLYLVLSLLINISLLGFFKYYNFFIDSLIIATEQIGFPININTLNIILPVGISFYTFQTLSYSIDIYRKKITPTKDIIAFFAFVSFFPQLVAGPIERASNLLPQFLSKRGFDLKKAKDGLRQILWGLLKKVVIADTLAIQVDQIFNTDQYSTLPGITLIIGSALFAFQLYCDFSGYSDIAIGTARLFGFSLKRNFAFPFFSRNIGELWQRWHISLSTWFRDYIFIPLGGNRGSKWKQVRNIMMTFVLSGFWHGANWTYIIWGALHGLYYVPLIFKKRKVKYTEIVAFERILPTRLELLQMLFTFSLFVFSMIFFRAASISKAFDFIQNIYVNISFKAEIFFEWMQSESIILIGLLILVEWIQRRKEHSLQIENLPIIFRWVIYVVSIGVFIYFGQFGKQQQFIYFQF
ncbi:MAG: MBOAT family protein [Bacteroidales bacterium]|nr:MBOAT family protein [Bacteroidales bacterium]